MSRLRCPLRTPGVIFGEVADVGADTGAGCLVSMGCGRVFGRVDGVRFGSSTSAILDVSIEGQPHIQCHNKTLFLLQFGSHEDHVETGN